LGIYTCSLVELASLNDHFAHGRLSVIWIEGGLAPSHKRPSSHVRSNSPFSCTATNDRSALEKRFRCGGVRNSSVACRIGRLDCGTKGCSERRLLHADAAGIRELCPFDPDQRLPGGVAPVCLRAHVQADARHSALRALAARLLAF